MKTYIIYKDSEQMAKFEHQNTDFEPFKFILKNQSHSTQWAMKYEGWKVKEIDEETGKETFWKP